MRKPLYVIMVLDTSADPCATVSAEEEDDECGAQRINEVNTGVRLALTCMRQYEANTRLFMIYYQIIELNSRGNSVFMDFVMLPIQPEELCRDDREGRNLEKTVDTLKTFFQPYYMPRGERVVNVILLSNGIPTDGEKNSLDESRYCQIIDSFKEYLVQNELKGDVHLYSIGKRGDSCEDMLIRFADEGNYYGVETGELLSEKMGLVIREALSHCSLPPEKSFLNELLDDLEDPEDL